MVQDYLPFLEKCPVISNKVVDFDTNNLLLTAKASQFNNLSDEFTSSVVSSIKSPTIYQVRPFNFYVMTEPDFVVYSIKKHMEKIKAMVVEVDYNDVLRNSYVDTAESGTTVVYSDIDGQEIGGVSDSYYLDFCLNHKDSLTDDHPFNNYINESIQRKPMKLMTIDEANLKDLFNKVDDDEFKNSVGNVESGTPTYVSRLDVYFQNDKPQNRIPLLLGQSGVAKSAMVKKLADQYGYRLVDIRLAFLSRLDLQGLSKVNNTEDLEDLSEIVANSAPASFMIECLDSYVDFCRKSIPIIEEKIETAEDYDKERLTKILNKFKEGAKPPVLFLDELMRCYPPIRQAFTKILSDKEFMGHPMKYAKIVAASNYAVGKEEDLQSIYQVGISDDAAFNDRFEPIPILPEDVIKPWKAWADEKSEGDRTNIHPVVREYLEKFPTQYYDFSLVEKVYNNTGDTDKAGETSYPNFRTWEMASKYLYQHPDKVIKKDIFMGLLGEGGENFYDYLTKLGYKEAELSDDAMSDFIEQGIDSNTPILLETASSMGKSSRLKAIANKRNALLIDVNLAEQDRLDLMGIPTTVSVERYILGGLNLNESELNELPKLSEFNLPEKTTIKACDGELYYKLRKAADVGQEVIIHFDEMNRLSDTTLMSAILEVISDHRFKGIKFNKDRVKVVGSCNVGEAYSDVKPLDPAFSARFSVLKKPEFDELDLKSFQKYMKDSEFAPEVQKYFNDLAPEDAIAFMNTVEKRSLECSSSSTRAWEDLSTFIKNSKSTSMFRGVVLFPDEKTQRQVADLISGDGKDTDFVDVYNTVKKYIHKWAGARGDYSVTLGGEQVDSQSVAETLQELVASHTVESIKEDDSLYRTFQRLAVIARQIDIEVMRDRKEAFTYIIGSDASSKFGQFYNNVSDREVEHYDLEDCVSIDILNKFLEQEISIIPVIEKRYSVVNSLFKQYIDHFDNKDPEYDREVVYAFLNSLPSNEYKVNMLYTGKDSTYFRKFINKAFDTADLLVELMGSVGVVVFDEIKAKVAANINKGAK